MKKLEIVENKTYLLMCGKKIPMCYDKGKVVSFGRYNFECVGQFKYLGLVFDRSASC